MNSNGNIDDVSILDTPDWIKEALQLADQHGPRPQIIGTTPPPQEDAQSCWPKANPEKNEAKREGKKKKKPRKKEKETAEREEGDVCGSEGFCPEASQRLGAVQEEIGDELDVRFRLLRDNYCALRHHYGQLRKKYQNLEKKHGKCPSSRRKKGANEECVGEESNDAEFESEEEECAMEKNEESEENAKNEGESKKRKLGRLPRNPKKKLRKFMEEEDGSVMKGVYVIVV